MSKYILSIDQGTTGSRVALFDKNGSLVGYAYKEHRQIYPRPGWVEHDPLEIWYNVKEIIKEVIRKTKISASQIAAIGVTNQRETTVIWDLESGKPLYNAIVWQDRRTAPLVDFLRKEYLEFIYSKTGLYPDAYFSSTKVWWLLENLPGIREKIKNKKIAFGTIDTWIIWNLTCNRKNNITPEKIGAHVIDYSNASRTMIFDIKKLRWDEELLEIQGKIPEEILPLPVPSSIIYGYTGPEVSRKLFEGHEIPVSGDAGDQQAALFGQAGFRLGTVKSTYGTGNFILMNIGETPVKSKNRLLTTVYYSLEKGKAVYALEGSIFVTGAAIQWLRDGLKIIKKSEEVNILAEKVASNEGVYIVPAFVGLGAPYWDMYARGLVVGITRGTMREHFARAILESIAYLTRDVIEAQENDTGLKIDILKADGGAARSDFLMQFQADILGIKVVRPVIFETTSLGAAYLAGLAVGFWNNLEEIEKLWKPERVFKPRMDENTRERLYRGWKAAVKRAFGWAKEVPWAYGY
ncbi:MAG: glycerol kinase [Thermofilum sp. ex4484_79]|nr:MAG: glycerol kinase [Thermofilum sp. ex4484_79]